MTTSRLYRDGTLVEKDLPLEDVSQALRDPAATVWVDLCAPDGAELDLLAQELSLHGLALEDAREQHERPKLDRYDTHLFLKAYVVRLDPATGRLTSHPISAFVTRQALVTVRPDESVPVEELTRHWDAEPDLARHGATFLLHGVLDCVVDSHFAAVQALDDGIESLEDLLFDDRPRGQEVQRRSFELRKSLVSLRRVVLPMREVVNALMRRDLHVLDDAMVPYYQDVYDHVLRATEWTESLRDLVTTILETHLTIQGNRLNTIMKQLTSWAAIIAVPTAVTGYFGQNVPFPGFEHTSGYVLSMLLIAVPSVVLYVVFRRRDWL